MCPEAGRGQFVNELMRTRARTVAGLEDATKKLSLRPGGLKPCAGLAKGRRITYSLRPRGPAVVDELDEGHRDRVKQEDVDEAALP